MLTEPREYALAVDIGGTKVEAALIDAAGRIRPGSRLRRTTGPNTTREGLQQSVFELCREVMAHHDAHTAIVGVGIGSAGPVDLPQRSVAPLNMPEAAGATFDDISDLVQAPLSLALDGTCIALAEHRYGAARGYNNALVMVVSTGVGGGLIINGQPFTGRSGNAGHIGQVRIQARESGDVHSGTVEDLASGPRTVQWARQRGWKGFDGVELARAYVDGDPIARAAVQRSTNAIGNVIASISTLLDIEVAVIAGGFVQVAPDYVSLVTAAVHRDSVFPHSADVVISPTGLSGSGPLIGAAALVFSPESSNPKIEKEVTVDA